MKNLILLLFSFHALSGFSQSLPFFLDLEQVDAPDLPAAHSFAQAQLGDKWLIVGGEGGWPA